MAAAAFFDLAGCTPYFDSSCDVPFLEIVGHPLAVNPDRERGGPMLEFSRLLPRAA